MQPIEDEVVETPPGATGSAPVNEDGSLPADDAPIVEATGDDDAPADDGAGAHRNKGVERRIGQLTRRYRNEQRENEQLRARLDTLEERLGPVPEPERPSSTDFETAEEYEDALLDWHNDSRQPAETTTTTAAEPVDEAGKELKAGIEGLAEAHPDAMEVVFDDDWPCSTATYEFIVSSDRGPALAYALASDLDLADKIHGMTPAQAARELVKIEATLPKPIASATAINPAPPPPPGEPVIPGSTAVPTDPDKMSAAQWRAWREKDLSSRA